MRSSVVMALALVLVGCLPDSIEFFRASAIEVDAGETVTLSWNGTGTCTLSPSVGVVPSEGSAAFAPEATTTFQLACGAVVRELTVAVRKATITAFAAPDSAPIDSMVSLTWSSERTTSCHLEPGTATDGPAGTGVFLLQMTTTFTLSCSGVGGVVTATKTVLATPSSALPVPTDVHATPLDAEVTLTWVQAGGGRSNVSMHTSSPVTKQSRTIIYRNVLSPFTVAALTNGQPYFFRVASFDGTNESDLSAEVSATPVGSALEDPLFPEQWHLLNVGQTTGGVRGEDLHVVGAWDAGFRGEGVRVALVDDGVDAAHEDLRQNLATQQSHAYVTAPASASDHGTSCAGLIAARDHNGKGGRGVAPHANLVAYNLLLSSSSDNTFDAMTRDAVNNWVSSNSWGDAQDGTGVLTDADPLWLNGIKQGVRVGRHGLGTVYVWASGNGGDSRYVDDANFDRQANQRYQIAVAGVGDDGVKASYSEAGACVWVAAPTEGDSGNGIVTTDITGTAGYNSGHSGELSDAAYTNTFSGTSASTPIVAGAVAVVLQANPNLTWRDVRRVLAYSARKNDPTDSDWSTNGAGLPINHKYGFGVVDVEAAVRVAQRFDAGTPERLFTAPLVSPALDIDDVSVAVESSQTISASNIGHLEWVELTVSIDHARSGDLEIVLEHAGGARDVMHPVHRCAIDRQTQTDQCAVIDGYTFSSGRHLDEPGNGVWTVKVRDGRSGVTGTLTSWQLQLFGRP